MSRVRSLAARGALAACFGAALFAFSASTLHAQAPTPRDSTFVTDGAVHTMASTGSTIFVGGTFTHIGPFTGDAAILSTANPVPTHPMLRIPNRGNTQVTCAASDSTGGWFLGGTFVEAQGQPHAGLLHVRADGTIANWAPAPNGAVTALAFVSGKLYVAGLFTSIAGKSRTGLAVVDTGTAAALAWNPVHGPGAINGFLLAGGKLYLYGTFRSMNGEGRASIAAFDPVTGALLPDVPSGPDRRATGSLTSVAANADRLFMAGDFSYLSPPTGAMANIDSLAGAAVAPFADLVGTVRATVPDGAGGWFVGGALTTARGQACTNVVHLDANGALTSWAPAINGEVLSLALCGDTLFVGGSFTQCDGQSRPYLASWRLSTGTLLPRPPAPDGIVTALARNGDVLFVGGRFTALEGAACAGLAALEWRRMKFAAQQPWGCGSGVNALLTYGSSLYVGGLFSSITPAATGFTHTDSTGADADPAPLSVGGTGYALAGDGAGGWYLGGTFSGAPAFGANLMHRRADGSLGGFAPQLNGTVRTLLRSGDTLYVGGAFSTADGQPRSGLAAFDLVTGALLPFDAGLSAAASVRALALANDTLYLGGSFTSAAGQPRAALACVNAATGAAFAWAPALTRTSGAPEVQSIVTANGLVWIAGLFSTVSAAAHSCVAAIDPATGLATAWAPSISAQQECRLDVRGSLVYVGGDFLLVNGVHAQFLTVLDATTGIAVPGWPVRPNGHLRSVRVTGNTLRVAGSFTYVGLVPRNYAAEFDATTGALLPYSATVSSLVNAFERVGNDAALAGAFTTSAPATAHNLVGFDLASMKPTGFAPNVDGEVTCLDAADGTVYLGGSFVNVNSSTRLRLAAVDLNGATTSWLSHSGALIYAVAVHGSRLYAGGELSGKGYLRAISRVNSAVAWTTNPAGPVLALRGGAWLVAGGNTAGFGGAARATLGSVTIATGMPTSWAPVINGAPRALAVVNNTLFAGGTFTTISSASHPRLAAWNTSTNALLAFDPVPDGSVNVFAVSNDTLWVGGAFQYLAGLPRHRLAALSATTLAPLDILCGADAGVAVLATARGTLAVAGPFQSVGMSARGGLAAVDARTGYVRPWDPRTTGSVNELRLLGDRVYAGGTLWHAEAPVRSMAMAFDTATAAVAPWAPEPDGTVYSLAPHAGSFYIGGAFMNAGGAARAGLARVDTTAGTALAWNPGTNGTPIRLAIDSDTLFVGGAFTTVGGQARGNAASFDASSGALTPWNPAANNQVTSFAFRPGQVYVGGAFTSIGGAARNKLALLDRASAGASAFDWGLPNGVAYQVDAIEWSGDMLFVGGAFSFGSTTQYLSNLVALDAASASLLDWVPGPLSGVKSLLRERGLLHVGGFFTNIAGWYHPGHAVFADPSYTPEWLDAPNEARPLAFALAAPAPNPARGVVRLAFTLPSAGRVRLGLYDVGGRRAATVVPGVRLEAGRHERAVDLSRLAPGLYWYRLEFGGRNRVRPLTILP